jgi:hypothetical protein
MTNSTKWLGAATLIVSGMTLSLLGCKNSNTVAGPLSTTATPAATSTPAATATRAGTSTPAPTMTRTPPPVTATPAPTALPLTLTGTWTGTVRYRDLDWWSPCGDPAFDPEHSATAIVSQNGSSITAYVSTRCIHSATFQGTLDNGHLSGSIRFQSGAGLQTGTSTGSAGAALISLLTPALQIDPSYCPGMSVCQVGGFDLELSR